MALWLKIKLPTCIKISRSRIADIWEALSKNWAKERQSYRLSWPNICVVSALQLPGGVGHRIGQWLHPALSLLPLRSQLGQSIKGGAGVKSPALCLPVWLFAGITPVTIAHLSLMLHTFNSLAYRLKLAFCSELRRRGLSSRLEDSAIWYYRRYFARH